jgi:hypothetical protein
MIPPQRIIRGVKDIRTRSGSPDQVLVPYKAYMVITALEMEKFRRETERKNLTVRLESINNRLRTIEAEKTALIRRLGKGSAGKAIKRSIKSSLSAKESTPNGRAGGFKYQY